MKNESPKIAIVGSRQRTDKHNVIKLVDGLAANVCVVSGGCRGVDTWAIMRANQRGLKTIVYTPNLQNAKQHWEITRAFHARNQKLAQEADIIYAFVSPGRKGGTENTIQWAKKLNKKVVLMNGSKTRPKAQPPLPFPLKN